MAYQGTEITGHPIVFSVIENKGVPMQYLSITPVAFLDYLTLPPAADLVMVEIRLVVVHSQTVADEHISVGSLEDLYNLLRGYQNGKGGGGVLQTADGHLEMAIDWRADCGDVRFTGRMPASEYPELAAHPLRLRDAIYRTQAFQFAIPPDALGVPIIQLDLLLRHLRTLKSRPRNSSPAG
jgi:hypothetical protein